MSEVGEKLSGTAHAVSTGLLEMPANGKIISLMRLVVVDQTVQHLVLERYIGANRLYAHLSRTSVE